MLKIEKQTRRLKNGTKNDCANKIHTPALCQFPNLLCNSPVSAQPRRQQGDRNCLSCFSGKQSHLGNQSLSRLQMQGFGKLTVYLFCAWKHALQCEFLPHKSGFSELLHLSWFLKMFHQLFIYKDSYPLFTSWCSIVLSF